MTSYKMTLVPEDKNQRKIALVSTLRCVQEWLSSEDVFVVDKDGNRIEGATVNNRNGSLLFRMLPYIEDGEHTDRNGPALQK